MLCGVSALLVLVVPPPSPAAACSCVGDAIQTAEAMGPPDVVFTPNPRFVPYRIAGVSLRFGE